MVDCLIWGAREQPGELQLLDDDLLEILLDDMQQLDADDALPAYAPILVNIIRHFLAA